MVGVQNKKNDAAARMVRQRKKMTPPSILGGALKKDNAAAPLVRRFLYVCGAGKWYKNGLISGREETGIRDKMSKCVREMGDEVQICTTKLYLFVAARWGRQYN